MQYIHYFRGLNRFLQQCPNSNSKNIVISHGFEKITQDAFSEICDGSLRVMSGGRFVEKKGLRILLRQQNYCKIGNQKFK